MMPVSAAIMICCQRQRRRSKLLGMRPPAMMKRCPYVVHSLTYVPPETADGFKLLKPNKRPLRSRKSGKWLATRNTEQSASDDESRHRTRSNIYTHTTVTTDVGSYDKQLTFEQCQTDVGPKLNLVEDIVDNRNTASQHQLSLNEDREDEKEEKQRQSDRTMPSSNPVSPQKANNRQSKKIPIDNQRSSPKRKHKVRQPTRCECEETGGKDRGTRANRHKTRSLETEGRAHFVSEGTFY
uniref:Uncharacterized protein n=1 Tax=Parascaris univalens TaxID=6257 RepID=A0A915C840_PARUN